MYEYLRGSLVERSPAHAVLDVGGIGFRIAIPLSTYEKLTPLGSLVQLHIVLVVREDSQRLFGFATLDERAFFVGLQTVSGIGPAVALGIVSSMTFSSFRAAVTAGDASQLRRIRGVGKRLSERLVVELRDKLGADGTGAAAGGAHSAASHDAQMALEQLGFDRDAAALALSELRRESPSLDDAGELVRRALKRL